MTQTKEIMRKVIIIAAAVLGMVSCKKEEEEVQPDPIVIVAPVTTTTTTTTAPTPSSDIDPDVVKSWDAVSVVYEEDGITRLFDNENWTSIISLTDIEHFSEGKSLLVEKYEHGFPNKMVINSGGYYEYILNEPILGNLTLLVYNSNGILASTWVYE